MDPKMLKRIEASDAFFNNLAAEWTFLLMGYNVESMTACATECLKAAVIPSVMTAEEYARDFLSRV